MVEATLARVKAYAGWIAGCVGAILAYLAGFDLLSKYISSQDEMHLAANIYVVVLSFSIVILAAWRQWITIRKEKYANIMPILHAVHHEIRDLNTFIHLNEPKDNPERYDRFINDCEVQFGRVLDQIKNVFNTLTSTHCRATIKLTYEKNGKVYVCTLTRDQNSKHQCLSRDNKRLDEDHDPLEENPQFARLFNGKVLIWHYICNNLPDDADFRCTSMTAYDPEYGTRAPRSRWARFWSTSWPLPYKSALVCVIRQGQFDLNKSIAPEVLGFLSVDSESRGVFQERWDAQLMFSVADALYGPVRGYIAAQNRARIVNQSATIRN